MDFNYALARDDYSLKNVLLWGNCILHCKKAGEGDWCGRIVHLLIAGVEIIPVIGQIASLFEMIIVTRFAHSSSNANNELDRKRISAEPPPEPINNETFVEFQERTSKHLYEQIKLQSEHPTYRRQKLALLNQEKVNSSVVLDIPPKGIQFFSKGATFYGYNAEGIQDYGWGCAWRALQTSLSDYNFHRPFIELFHLFGPLSNLTKIYQNKYAGERLTSSTAFAPYDLSSGWAEPFIGEMAMHYLGLDSKLETVNGLPGGCRSPKSVFRNEPLTFVTFKERIRKHFEEDEGAPIMIDDGTYTMNIVGIGFEGLITTLWIADPHIGEGVNKGVNAQKANGLYRVTVNSGGEQIYCSLNDEDRHQVPNLFSAGSYNGIHFNAKQWMVLFPI